MLITVAQNNPSLSNIDRVLLIDEKELSRITGRSLGSLRRDRRLSRGVPYVKIHGSVRYVIDDVRQYLAALPRLGGRMNV